jgi:hypothetical protein
MPAVLDVLQGIYAQQDVDSFAARVVESLPRLIPTDMASFNEGAPRTGRNRPLVPPVGADRFPGSETRTVAKHLERIFRKLGVETRTAAAAAVLNCPAS